MKPTDEVVEFTEMKIMYSQNARLMFKGLPGIEVKIYGMIGENQIEENASDQHARTPAKN